MTGVDVTDELVAENEGEDRDGSRTDRGEVRLDAKLHARRSRETIRDRREAIALSSIAVVSVAGLRDREFDPNRVLESVRPRSDLVNTVSHLQDEISTAHDVAARQGEVVRKFVVVGGEQLDLVECLQGLRMRLLVDGLGGVDGALGDRNDMVEEGVDYKLRLRGRRDGDGRGRVEGQ